MFVHANMANSQYCPYYRRATQNRKWTFLSFLLHNLNKYQNILYMQRLAFLPILLLLASISMAQPGLVRPGRPAPVTFTASKGIVNSVRSSTFTQRGNTYIALRDNFR